MRGPDSATGINAEQSIANAVGATELQERINCQTVAVLRRYHDTYRALRLSSPPAATTPPAGGETAGSGATSAAADGAASAAPTMRVEAAHASLLSEMRRLETLMVGVETAVLRSVIHVDKNTDVIALSERLVRELRGGSVFDV